MYKRLKIKILNEKIIYMHKHVEQFFQLATNIITSLYEEIICR